MFDVGVNCPYKGTSHVVNICFLLTSTCVVYEATKQTASVIWCEPHDARREFNNGGENLIKECVSYR